MSHKVLRLLLVRLCQRGMGRDYCSYPRWQRQPVSWGRSRFSREAQLSSLTRVLCGLPAPGGSQAQPQITLQSLPGRCTLRSWVFRGCCDQNKPRVIRVSSRGGVSSETPGWGSRSGP